MCLYVLIVRFIERWGCSVHFTVFVNLCCWFSQFEFFLNLVSIVLYIDFYIAQFSCFWQKQLHIGDLYSFVSYSLCIAVVLFTICWTAGSTWSWWAHLSAPFTARPLSWRLVHDDVEMLADGAHWPTQVLRPLLHFTTGLLKYSVI